MSSNTLETSYTNGQVIDASHVNELTLALLGAFVGRDAAGVPTPDQSLGSLAIPWGALYCNSIILDGLSLDTTQITSIPNRIVSGKTRPLSSAPDFIRANGSELSFQILGATTNLVLSIDNTAVSVITDLEKTGLTAAPVANNTCLVNDASLLNSKTIGEDGTTITIDNVGSNISALVGQIVAFKVGVTSEILIGFLESATSISNVFRGYFFDASGNPLVRDNLSNNDTLTLLSLGWIFLEDNGTTVDVSYNTPIISFESPSSPSTGNYWFDMANQTWKRYSGVSWEIINRMLIGSAVCDTTACIATRSVDFYKKFSDENNTFVIRKSVEILELSRLSSRLSVYGNELNYDLIKPSWNMTTNLDTGLTEANSTVYYCYLSENGKTIISDVKPYERRDIKGYYHPYESWRCVSKFLNDSSGDIQDIRQIGKPIDNFVGIIFDYAGQSTPEDCLVCDGSSLKRADFPELFNAVGTRWGTADADHFNIPDMRGRFKRAWANGSGNDPDRATRTASATGGATGDNVGSVQLDQMQKITGSFTTNNNTGTRGLTNANGVGAIDTAGSVTDFGSGAAGGFRNSITFDSANSPSARVSSSTSGETRAKNAYVNMVIKYR